MNRSILALLSIFIGVLLLHTLILSKSFKRSFNSSEVAETNSNPLKIRQIRTLGIEESEKNNFFLSGKQNPAPTPKQVQQKKGNPLQNLDLSDLNISPNTQVAPKKVAKAIENLNIKGAGIKDFLKTTPTDGQNAKNSMPKPSQRFGQKVDSPATNDSSMNNSDVAVNLEVPKGVNLDELNKEELMFYSFQRRSALQYVSAFYNKLQEFERQNPHLQFPMTKDKARMTGRITYDKDGNIMRIKMLEWTKTQPLQDFFVEVLQEMNSLPNPPKLLIDENGEFSIVYSLIINV